MACWLVFAGAFFDVLDGFAARATGGGSALGAQLDSLADLVTFGVAPAMIIWFMVLMPLAEPMQFLSIMAVSFEGPVNVGGKLEDANQLFALTGITVLILVVASAWRLAKFNVDTRQTHGFLGLATPANGLFWASLPLAITGSGGLVAPFGGLLKSFLLLLLYSPYLMIIALIMGGLMLSELQLPGLKFKHYGWQGNQVIYILLRIGIPLIALLGMPRKDSVMVSRSRPSFPARDPADHVNQIAQLAATVLFAHHHLEPILLGIEANHGQ